MSGRRLLVTFALALVTCVDQATSQPFNRLSDLMQEALTRNSEIRAAWRHYQAQTLWPAQVTRLTGPILSLGYSSSGRPWPGARLGLDPTSQIGFMLSQELPFPGKREVLGVMAAKETELAALDLLQVQLRVLSNLKQAYLRWSYTQAMLGLLEENSKLLRFLLEVTETAYAAGRAGFEDVLRVQAQIMLFHTRQLLTDQESRILQQEVLSLIARPPGSGIPPPEPLPTTFVLPDIEALLDVATKSSPLLLRAQSTIGKTELALIAARKNYYPDLVVNAGYAYMGTMPDMYSFRLDVKLPSFRKQQAAEVEQLIQVERARREYESLASYLHYRVRQEYLTAQAAARLAETYLGTILPHARFTFDAALAAYQAGKVGFQLVLQAAQTLFEYRAAHLEASLNFYLASSRLQELTGTLIHEKRQP